jgi:hypothetical protein
MRYDEVRYDEMNYVKPINRRTNAVPFEETVFDASTIVAIFLLKQIPSLNSGKLTEIAYDAGRQAGKL